MSTAMDDWKVRLAALPIHERAELAHYLIRTLNSAEQDHTDQWIEVAEKRMAEVRAGKVQGVTVEELLSRLPGHER